MKAGKAYKLLARIWIVFALLILIVFFGEVTKSNAQITQPVLYAVLWLVTCVVPVTAMLLHALPRVDKGKIHPKAKFWLAAGVLSLFFILAWASPELMLVKIEGYLERDTTNWYFKYYPAVITILVVLQIPVYFAFRSLGFFPSKKETTATKTILVLSANPSGTDALNVDVEVRKIKDILRSAEHRDKFVVVAEPAVRIDTITQAMQQHLPEIVHFSGHGASEDGIIVEDEQGRRMFFETSGLRRLFGLFSDQVECVVLNACYSHEQAQAIGLSKTFVVGMRKAISDDAAIRFARGFYQALGEGNDYAFAYDIGIVHLSSFSDSDGRSVTSGEGHIPELWKDGQRIKPEGMPWEPL